MADGEEPLPWSPDKLTPCYQRSAITSSEIPLPTYWFKAEETRLTHGNGSQLTVFYNDDVLLAPPALSR
ncbi:MAG: hypothetical protein ABI988_14210, partial [Nitrospirota bacterium]